MAARNNSNFKSPAASAHISRDIIRGDHAMALSKLGDMPKRSLNFQFYRSLIRDSAKANNFVACQWTMAQMRSAGLKVNVIMLNSLIADFAQMGASQIAARWFAEMEGMGITPNRITYNTLIKACAQARDQRGAQTWLQMMTERGVRPCVISFGLLIDVFAKTGDIAGAEYWFARLEASGVKPDLVIFNSLINAAARCSDTAKARQWLERMIAFGIQPDERSYNCVIHACAKVGNVEEAEEWLQVMGGAGLVPDEVTYGSLLNACAKRGDVDRAERWIDSMVAAGLEPNQVCLTIVIHACAKTGDRDRAEKWFYKAESVGNGLPNRIAYNCVICACIKSGCYDAAEDWLDQMATVGLAPDMSTQSSMLRVIQEMQGSSRAATMWAFATLVRVALQNGDANSSKLVRTEAIKAGLGLQRVMQLATDSRRVCQALSLTMGPITSTASMTSTSREPARAVVPGDCGGCSAAEANAIALVPPSNVPISPWVAAQLGRAPVPQGPVQSQTGRVELHNRHVLIAQALEAEEDDESLRARQAHVPGIVNFDGGADLGQAPLGQAAFHGAAAEGWDGVVSLPEHSKDAPPSGLAELVGESAAVWGEADKASSALSVARASKSTCAALDQDIGFFGDTVCASAWQAQAGKSLGLVRLSF